MKKREGRANSDMNYLLLGKITENKMALETKGRDTEGQSWVHLLRCHLTTASISHPTYSVTAH